MAYKPTTREVLGFIFSLEKSTSIKGDPPISGVPRKPSNLTTKKVSLLIDAIDPCELPLNPCL